MRPERGMPFGDLGFGLRPGEAEARHNDPAERGSYRAFELAPRATTLWTFTLRWREAGGAGVPVRLREKVIPYHHLGEIDRTGDEHLSLITTYSLVHLEGEQLSPVIAGMVKRQVEAMQEWGDCWDRPAAGTPLIARIRVEPLGRGR